MLWAHCSVRCRSWLQRTWKSLLHLSLYEQDQPSGIPGPCNQGEKPKQEISTLVEEDWIREYLKNLIGVYKSLMGGCKEDRARLCARSQCQDQRPWAHTGTQEVPLNIRKHFFTVRVAEHWHRLPREVTESPSLEILKINLDMDVGNQLWVALLELRVGPSGLQRPFPNSTLL